MYVLRNLLIPIGDIYIYIVTIDILNLNISLAIIPFIFSRIRDSSKIDMYVSIVKAEKSSFLYMYCANEIIDGSLDFSIEIYNLWNKIFKLYTFHAIHI